MYSTGIDYMLYELERLETTTQAPATPATPRDDQRVRHESAHVASVVMFESLMLRSQQCRGLLD